MNYTYPVGRANMQRSLNKIHSILYKQDKE